jgi:hypothetical protein
VVPASISVRGGATVPITVYALRRDGFTGDIALKLKDAPPGFTLTGGWVPANQDKVRLTLTVPPNRIEKPRSIHLEGRGSIQGKEVTRVAVPAEDMMQAFYYHHLVAARDWMVRVTPPGRSRQPWKLALDKPVRLPMGGSASVRMVLPLGQFADQLRLVLNEPPEGITIHDVSAKGESVSFLLKADGAKLKPGLKGNLIVDGFLERAVTPGQGKAAVKRRQPLGTLPAVPFEVVQGVPTPVKNPVSLN